MYANRREMIRYTMLRCTFLLAKKTYYLPSTTNRSVPASLHIAWFHNYYQFKDIRQRLGIDGNFKPWEKVHFLFKKYKPEVIYSSGPYPFNLMGG